ncbi:Do family serine endopeptidase [Phenylobacterium montanum]|uniref:Do family serine endopeptidase n=1 Tax=Phenylobacterium montanum TaxID=2823693 RepID=A0A975G0P0_9CAUL|nr:Do family serine endopeptidase [Caulobacter sp. S6]QUD88434.1 Do family serine endopeptidase [Caulobacter sp. S6]
MRPQHLALAALCLLAACSRPAGTPSAQGLPAAPSMAEADRRAPVDAAAVKMSYAPVVRKAAPAVVNVYSRRVVRQAVDPFWGMFGGGLGLSRDRIAQSLGSGVIVRSDGVIVTNNHVIEGGQEIMVVLGDRREFPAKVLMADPRADVAVLKIDAGAERLPVLALDDHEDAQIGDLVLAIGDPFGVGQTVTNGIVSALNRTGVGITDVGYFIQTDAAINPGNSGGALVNMNGDMIGMNTAILSQSGQSSGVGFAIPAALVKRVVETAIGGAKSAQLRPWLGLKTQPVTSDIAKTLGLDRPNGVLVTDVYPDGPGARAGVRQGDLILSVDGAPVQDEASLNYRVLTHKAGDEIALQIRREKGGMETVRLRASSPPAGPGRDERLITGRNPFSGATVVNLSPAVADELGLDPFAAGKGVLITKVEDGVAAGLGLQPGDLIKQVNGRPIETTAQLQAALAAGGPVWRITLVRNGQVLNAQVRL